MEERQRLYTVMAVVAVVAILLSCVMGAAAGALAGLVVGQNQGRVAAERAIVREREFQAFPEAVPVPEERGLMPRLGVEGAAIVEVIAGTPAEEAGLGVGDVILAVDRTPINAIHNLGDVLAQYRPGDRPTFRVWRGGEVRAVPVVLGEHPTQQGRPYLGIRYQMSSELDPDRPNE
ncbi:MAG TPA: PDZ domain-containing protein [Anaerolineae bacterium]|nr:PDZ domain-containing protein [Anaerolineae bacterium]